MAAKLSAKSSGEAPEAVYVITFSKNHFSQCRWSNTHQSFLYGGDKSLVPWSITGPSRLWHKSPCSMLLYSGMIHVFMRARLLILFKLLHDRLTVSSPWYYSWTSEALWACTDTGKGNDDRCVCTTQPDARFDQLFCHFKHPCANKTSAIELPLSWLSRQSAAIWWLTKSARQVWVSLVARPCLGNWQTLDILDASLDVLMVLVRNFRGKEDALCDCSLFGGGNRAFLFLVELSWNSASGKVKKPFLASWDCTSTHPIASQAREAFGRSLRAIATCSWRE